MASVPHNYIPMHYVNVVNEIYHFTLNVSPHYRGKTKNDSKRAHVAVNHHSAFDRTGCSQLSQ